MVKEVSKRIARDLRCVRLSVLCIVKLIYAGFQSDFVRDLKLRTHMATQEKERVRGCL